MEDKTPALVDYRIFQALTTLAPELHNPRLASLKDPDQKSWAQGKTRPASKGVYAENDFNRNDKPDAALLVTSAEDNYLILAERTSGKWALLDVLKVKEDHRLQWDGQVLRVAQDTIVAPAGARFKLMSDPLSTYVHHYKTDDYAGVMIRLAYIGPQRKAYPALLLFSYYKAPNPSLFQENARGFETRAPSPGNLWHLTLSPTLLERIVQLLDKFHVRSGAAERTQDFGYPLSHSIFIVDMEGDPHPVELLITPIELVSLLDEIASLVSQEDTSAGKVLRQYGTNFP